jgi:hypothetical protein
MNWLVSRLCVRKKEKRGARGLRVFPIIRHHLRNVLSLSSPSSICCLLDLRSGQLCPKILYHTSSEDFTISNVGVLGTILFIRFRSSLVTNVGVIGTQGVNG